MCVVSRIRLIFNVCRRDSDTTFSFFGSFVNGAIFEEVCKTFLGLSLRDRCRESSLAVVDVADCSLETLATTPNFSSIELKLTDVYVRLAPLENSCIVPRRRDILSCPFRSKALLHRIYAASSAQCRPPSAEERLRECRHGANDPRRRKEGRRTRVMMDWCRPSKNIESSPELSSAEITESRVTGLDILEGFENLEMGIRCRKCVQFLSKLHLLLSQTSSVIPFSN